MYVALVEWSEEFVLGYIQLLDGERDPRNLVLAFSSIFIIVQNFTFGKFLTVNPVSVIDSDQWFCCPDSLTEDLFDVISCYFPIDFTPVSG